jgi:hypothetical protein
MDTTEDTSESKFTAKDAAAAVTVAVVVTVMCIAAGKFTAVVTEKAVDAVVNTLTLARKRKNAQEVQK